MQEISFGVIKNVVFDEVAKTTAYIGAKNTLSDGKSAYDQMFVTDADRNMIERFYRESADMVTNLLKRFVKNVSVLSVGGNLDMGENYTLEVELSDRFDDNVTSSINSSMFSFFVNSMVAKWCEITANDKVKEYADTAAAALQDIKEKVFYKVAPTRVKPIKN